MAELEEYPEEGTLEEKVQWIRNINADTLLNSEKFGETYLNALENFKKIQGLLERLIIDEVELVTQRWGTNFLNHIQQVKDSIVRINDPSIHAEQAGAIAQDCQKQFLNIMQQMSQELAPYQLLISSPPTQTKSTDLIHITGEANRTLSEVEKIREQAVQAVDGITSQAALTGVAAESRHFHNESTKHEESARKWLLRSIGLGVILLALVTWFHFFDKPPASNIFAWNHFIPRFSILGLLVFFEILIIGIFRAERHNAIVNKHRANALNTFETITAATSVTKDVKDAVTLTAAGAIYAPQETGFSKRGTNASTAHVADILASLTTERS